MILKTQAINPEEIPLGCSKMWGGPDLPEDFDFPMFKDEVGDEYHYRFVCQIDCREAAPFDSEGLLPKTGILYFFARIGYYFSNSFDDEPRNSGWWDLSDTKVIYVADNDDKHLAEAILLDDDDQPIAPADERITFEAGIPQAGHQLLGKPSYLAEELEEDPDRLLLLQLDSCQAGDEELNFCDCGMLYFTIRREDLLKKDFSKVQGYLATS